MKKLLFASALLACTLSAAAQQVTTRITGEKKDAKMAYLHILPSILKPTDSVKVVNDKFVMDVKLEKGDFALIRTDNDKRGIMVIADGQPVKLNLNDRTFSGSELNNKYCKINAEDEKYSDKVYNLLTETMKVEDEDSVKAAAMTAEMLKLTDEASEFEKKMFLENKDNPIGVYYLNMSAIDMDYETLIKYVNKDSKMYNHPWMAPLKKRIADIAKRAPGKMYTDLSIPDMDGKMHKLSEWCGKDKVVLIDFWASWCGPCRMEMPNVVENYKKYKDMGFEIIGISFDKTKDAWVKGVKELGMEWPQLSELKYWDNEAAKVYDIKGIPANILVDKTGKIIDVDLRDESLGDKLKEIFGR